MLVSQPNTDINILAFSDETMRTSDFTLYIFHCLVNIQISLFEGQINKSNARCMYHGIYKSGLSKKIFTTYVFFILLYVAQQSATPKIKDAV